MKAPLSTRRQKYVEVSSKERMPVQYGERKRPEPRQVRDQSKLRSLTLPVLHPRTAQRINLNVFLTCGTKGLWHPPSDDRQSETAGNRKWL